MQGGYEACLITICNVLLHPWKSCRGVSFVSQRCSEQGAAVKRWMYAHNKFAFCDVLGWIL